MVKGSIDIDGNISISKIADQIAKAKDESCIYKFLSQSLWDDKLLNRNSINFLEHHLEYNTHPGQVGFLVIDDTVNIKNIETRVMKGLDFHYSHSQGKTCWSHCIVTSNFVTGDYSVPLHFKPYYRQEKCEELEVEFRSKVEIAKEFVKSFNPTTNLKQLYLLTDSWYTGTPLIEEALSKGYHLIGGIKPNRTISPCSINPRISQFIPHIEPSEFDIVTIKGKEYRIYRYEGKVDSFDNAILLISYDVTKDGFKIPISIICNDIDLDTETSLSYYSNWWTIKTNYHISKKTWDSINTD
ncbi:MAG: transposase [Xylanivirga thermophila]|jgi:5-hydroxyisourate hydrolase-like protein (transthyretin family)|uniref:transposase n=1 Tax=Xylanivirga thermophila TaxID=2496273 RepID=UPI0039F62A38